MRRHIWRIMAATAAAPYVAGLLIGFFTELGDVARHGEPLDLPSLLKFLPISTVVLIVAGIPILFASALCAALLNAAGWNTRRASITAGSLTGFCFIALLTSSPANFGDEWAYALAIGTLPGGVCGWIYWRIAIKQTPENPRAIDPA
jgi:peptidoglycan biosynthesis protein MviN/MurJ (putative lipid II flippase)